MTNKITDTSTPESAEGLATAKEAYNFLKKKLEAYFTDEDLEKVAQAYKFAAKAHNSQFRKTGEPYITHPLSVASILTELRLDQSSIIAAILHDVVEDTPVTVKDIAASFGQQIADLVDGLTKISKIKFQSNQERMAENFRKMIIAMAKDLRVIMVKLADRLHNMRTLGHLAEEKRQRIAQETMEIYAPIAGRLGIYGIKSELEDLCLRELKYDTYQDIKSNITHKKDERQLQIAKVLEKIHSSLEDYGLKEFEVYGRPKHFFSIYKKMSSSQVNFEDIYDLFAYRILVQSVKDCYEALGLVHSIWKPMPGRFKDYIAMPKPNMYQSLHTTVIMENGDPAEIQIRTYDMHRVCEFGVAAHWTYKETSSKQPAASKVDLEKFSWLRQMMQWQNELKDPDDFMDAVKVDLFDEEIFVFTPNGDVIALASKASCLDFAFAVHTELGLKTSGAKINGRIVPLKRLLKSGDIVEIITSKQKKPNKDWLSFVHTSKARNKIRAYLRTFQRDKARVLGQALMTEGLKKIGRDVNHFDNQREQDNLIKAARESNYEDLLLSIGYGKISIDNILGKVFKVDTSSKVDEIIEKSKNKASQKKTPRSNIVVSGISNIMVRSAKCCNPLPGETITGFITRGRGVTVHRSDCMKALVIDPQRKIQVDWLSQTVISDSYPAYLRITTLDHPGMLATITSSISTSGINIMRADIRTKDLKSVMEFEIKINNLTQLRNVISKLESLPKVTSVTRVSDFNI